MTETDRHFISFHSSYWKPRMTDGQTTFHFIPHIGDHVWQTDRYFISFLILETTYDWDGQTFHFIPHIGNHVWLRRTDISFHSSYWKPYMTETDRHFISFLILETIYDWDGQTFHFIPHIGNHVWQTDRHFISFLILETTYDWDGQTFHFIPHIGNHVWLRRTDNISFHSSYWKPHISETDRQHFISFLILETTYDWDGQTFHFIPHIGNHVWQTDRHFISFLILETTYDRRTDNISFHSSYWKPRMTETDRHFISFHSSYWKPRMTETDRHFISFFILETTYETDRHFISFHSSYWKPRMTETDRHFISFHSSYWKPRMTDRRTDNISIHSSYWKPRMTDGQTFHFIPHIGNHVWQTDRHFISFLILETTYARRTDISFHSSYWKLCMTHGQTFHSSYWKPRMTDGQTDNISFLILETTYDRRTDILFLILENTYDRRTDISFHSSYWQPRMTDGQAFHFIPHIGNHVWQTDGQTFHSSYWKPRMSETDNISFHSSYWQPRMTEMDRQHFISFLILETTYDRDGQTFHFIPNIGNHVWQTDRHFISFLILETKLVSDIVTAGLGIEPLTFCSAGQELYQYPTASPSAHIGIQVRQTDGQTTVSFHPSYWIFTPSENSQYTVRQTVQTAFKSSCWGFRQMPKTYIWLLMLRCKTDTKLFSFLPLLTYLVILNVLWTWRFKLCILIKLTDHVHIHELILICQYLTSLSWGAIL